MNSEFLMIVGCAIMGLFAHVATNKRWAEWVLRAIIGLTCFGEGIFVSGLTPEQRDDRWTAGVSFGCFGLSGLVLLKPFRALLSLLFSAIELLFSKRAWVAAFKTTSALKEVFQSERVFVPTSIPHMVGFFIYVNTMASLLGVMHPSDFRFPGIALPMPVQIDQLISYNGIGLVLLSFCGVGVLVSRPFKEALKRLGLVKPTATHVAIGLGLIAFGFLNDYLWSLYTESNPMLPNILRMYNGGTFTAGGGAAAGPALILALATALCAGIGEETLFRGALQPAFGIVPAAVLHGVLHAQFAHAPIFIVQVACWSIAIGIVRRYTNTTTTIIGHAGFNFLTTFLFAFNP